MKKVVYIALVLILLFAVGCTGGDKNAVSVPDGVETPEIVSRGNIACAQRPSPLTFTEGGMGENTEYMKMVVADITINGWLDESEYCSYYSATVNDVLCGEVPQKRIAISSEGSTQIWIPGQLARPEKGERMIAFLARFYIEDTPNPLYTGEIETREWMAQTFLMDLRLYCDVVEKDGELYVMDPTGDLTKPVTGQALPADLFKEVAAVFREEFPQKRCTYYRAFTYNDFSALVEKYVPQN